MSDKKDIIGNEHDFCSLPTNNTTDEVEKKTLLNLGFLCG